MEVHIFDVAHGFCALVVADNGNTMLIDCGHNDETGFYPADYLRRSGCTGIERFFITNYDEDHLSGLPRLRELASWVPIHILHRNKSLTADQLRAIKRQGGPLGEGMKALLDMIATYTGEVTSPPAFPNVDYSVFYNSYPEFTDTNNLSLVLFVHYPGLSVVFPGDLEKAGWRELLKGDSFRQNLSRVNVFVASHHGRESGYTPEVFNHCRPDIVIISDESMQYETQQTHYAQHASGIPTYLGRPRKVYTTRNDGKITLSISTQSRGYTVTCG